MTLFMTLFMFYVCSLSMDRYKHLQTAFDELSDPYLKLKYDSSVPFDDTIPGPFEMAQLHLPQSEIDKMQYNKFPSDIMKDRDFEENCRLFGGTAMEDRIHCREQAFYDLFGPHFKKWSVYSTAKSIPQLGNDKTSDKNVKKFYSSWRNFKSWRVFLHEEEIEAKVMNLDNAENNKERQWMKKENMELQKPYKKQETIQLSNLVEAAYIRDPRISRILKKDKEKFLRELLKDKLENQRIEREREEKIQKEREEQLRKYEEQKAEEERRYQEAEARRMEREQVQHFESGVAMLYT